MQLVIVCENGELKIGDRVEISVSHGKPIDGRVVEPGCIGCNFGTVQSVKETDGGQVATIGY